MLHRKKPLKRSTKPIKRSPLRKVRATARPGRLKGADMAELRQQCLERDSEMCRECGKTVRDGLPDWHDDKYHMAHIKAKRMGGDSLENVRTLCGMCHRIEHSYGKSGVKPVPKKQ